MEAMAALTTDTHRMVKRLKDAGLTDSQAATVTDILAETRATDLADIATTADVAALRTEIKAGLSALEARIVKSLVPPMLGQTGLSVAQIKLLS